MKQRITIAIVTAAWKRPQVLEFFAWYWSVLTAQMERHGIRLTLWCAYSEDESRTILERHQGWNIVYADNQPLHAKWNTVCRAARSARPDYCLFLGSDDLMNGTALLRYADLMCAPGAADYIAPLDWWFFDTLTHAGLYWAGYRENYRLGEPCGAGRALSASILDRIDWSPWIPGHDRMLDTAFQKTMRGVQHTKHFVFLRSTPGACGLDVKTGTNMTIFRTWDNTTKTDDYREFLIKHFDAETAARLYAIEPGEYTAPPPPIKKQPAAPVTRRVRTINQRR